MNLYEKVKVLGEGSFGKAWLVRHKETKNLFVMKEMVASNSEELKEAMTEASFHSQVEHNRIISYREVIKWQKNTIVLVMEYAPGGDLAARIRRQKVGGRPFSESQILSWLVQACEALEYLHGQGMVHRDIKAANMFLDDKGEIKLGDFGVSRILEQNAPRMSARTCKTPVGTPMNMAPEIASGKKYGQKVDMWALGCVLYELMKLSPPFVAHSLDSLMSRIRKGKYDKDLPDVYSEDLKVLVHELLTANPRQRPSAHDIMEMPLLQPYVMPENRTPSPVKLSHDEDLHQSPLETLAEEEEEDSGDESPTSRSMSRKVAPSVPTDMASGITRRVSDEGKQPASKRGPIPKLRASKASDGASFSVDNKPHSRSRPKGRRGRDAQEALHPARPEHESDGDGDGLGHMSADDLDSETFAARVRLEDDVADDDFVNASDDDEDNDDVLDDNDDEEDTSLRRVRSMVYSSKQSDDTDYARARKQLSSISYVEDSVTSAAPPPVKPRRKSRIPLVRRRRASTNPAVLNAARVYNRPSPSYKASHHGRRRSSEPVLGPMSPRLSMQLFQNRSSEELLAPTRPHLAGLPSLPEVDGSGRKLSSLGSELRQDPRSRRASEASPRPSRRGSLKPGVPTAGSGTYLVSGDPEGGAGPDSGLSPSSLRRLSTPNVGSPGSAGSGLSPPVARSGNDLPLRYLRQQAGAHASGSGSRRNSRKLSMVELSSIYSNR